MDTPIAKFFATVKFVPDKASLKTTQKAMNKVLFGGASGNITAQEKQLFAKRLNSLIDGVTLKEGIFGKLLNKNLRGTKIHLNNFSLNRAALKKTVTEAQTLMGKMKPLRVDAVVDRLSLQTSLERAAYSLILPLHRFKIDKSSLHRSVQLATRGALANLSLNLTSKGRVTTPSGSSSGGGGYSRGGLGDIRHAAMNLHYLSPTAMGGGLAGALGLNALNQSIRTLQNLPVMLTSVTGSETRAKQELEFLNNLGNQVGARVSDMAPDYTKMLASTIGKPFEQVFQSSFTDFMRYSKVMGLDATQNKLVLKSATQMLSKGTIQSEELRMQMGDHLPAAMQIMANVAAGGDQGKLMKMMENRELDSQKYLPLFFAELGKIANQGWDKRLQTSGFWQDMTGKRLEDLVKLFAANGGNEAFVRIWKTFAETLKELDGITILLTKAFVVFSKALQEVGDILKWVDSWIDLFLKQSPQFQKNVEMIAAAWLLLATAIGRSMFRLLGVLFIISDLQSFFNGEDSIIGRIRDGTAAWEDWALAILSVVAALTALKGVAKSVGLGGLFGGDKDKAGKDKTGSRITAKDVMKGGLFAAVGTTLFSGYELFQAKGEQLKSEGTAAKMQALYSERLSQMTPEQIAALNDPTITADYNSRNSMLNRPNGYSTNNTNQFEIHINTPSTDPTQHANIVVDIINKSLPFYPIGEGAG